MNLPEAWNHPRPRSEDEAVAARLVLDEARCVGCFACEVACGSENELGPAKSWIHVSTDGPQLVNGDLKLAWKLKLDAGCTLCAHLLAQGEQPSCVHHCMAHCLHVES